VLGVRGTLRLRMECAPAFDYGREAHETVIGEHGATFHTRELTLSLSTVRTIVGKADGTDRTSKRQEMRRLELNRHDVAAYRARRRTRDGLGKRITAVLKEGRELLKAAKGLGR